MSFSLLLPWAGFFGLDAGAGAVTVVAWWDPETRMRIDLLMLTLCVGASGEAAEGDEGRQ